MTTVSFKFYSKTVYAPKSGIMLRNWQVDIKKAKTFDNEGEALIYIEQLKSLKGKTGLSDFKVITIN